MKKYYSSERLKEITFTNEIKQDLCIYDRKNQDKMITLIHDMDLEIEQLQQRIYKTINYCKNSSKTIKSEYFSDVIKILKGDLEDEDKKKN